MRGCPPTAAGSRGIAATSVLAASRQEQGATSVSETPPNTDDIPSPRSPAMTSSQCWSSARSNTSKKTAAKVLTNLPPRMTTARAVKLAGGMPLKLTETAPVETSCGNTTCSAEQRERRGSAEKHRGSACSNWHLRVNDLVVNADDELRLLLVKEMRRRAAIDRGAAPGQVQGAGV
jgi:hypothetical protein